MKKIVLMLALMMATMTVAANNILYFTYSQAARTVACLNSQNELMIYCGYENELPTYVLINEVWAEQISSSFYEIWLYGYDAYTGEEIYMPIDLECIYLMQNRNIYSAAQYLRFKYTHSRPTFVWVMPPYNPFVRVARPVTYYYTYHYDITITPTIAAFRVIPPRFLPSPTLPAKSIPAGTRQQMATSTTTCRWSDESPLRAQQAPCRTIPPDVTATASPATARTTPSRSPTAPPVAAPPLQHPAAQA